MTKYYCMIELPHWDGKQVALVEAATPGEAQELFTLFVAAEVAKTGVTLTPYREMVYDER